MKIYLHEITDQETHLEFNQDEPWVLKAVLGADEKSERVEVQQKKRPVHVEFRLTKVDDVVVVSGKIHTYLELMCSRCANPFHHTCNPGFSGLFCKDPVMAGIAHLQRVPDVSHGGETKRPVGQNQGFARHAHNPDDDKRIAEGKDLDITYLSQEYIDLGEVLGEQLQFQVPFQPLCQETCKGICHQCGADLNHGRCACDKIKAHHPFSVLRDFKI